MAVSAQPSTPTQPAFNRALHYGAGLLLCLLASALYSHRIDVRPLWWDEGFSIYVAHLNPLDLLRTIAADVHPPAYFLLLSGWVKLTGATPFSVRSLSMLTSVLTVAMLYATGRRINGFSGAVLTSALSIASPYLLYYARETRMYSVGIFLASASLYSFMRLTATPAASRWWWLLNVGSITLGLSTHYAFAILPAAQIATIVALQRAALRRWLLAGCAAALLFAPWLIFARAQLLSLQSARLSGASQLQLGWPALGAIQPLITGYVPGSLPTVPVATGLFVAVVLIGVVALQKRQRVLAVALGLCICGALAVILLVRYTPGEAVARGTRLGFTALPGLCLLGAAGLQRLWRLERWAGVAALAALSASLLPATLAPFSQPADVNEDYRPLVRQVQLLAKPEDAVLAPYVWQQGYFASYAPGPLKFYRGAETPDNGPASAAAIFAAHPRLWVLNYRADVHAPEVPLNAWLNRNAALAFEHWFGNTQLALFVRAEPAPDNWPALALLEQNISVEYSPPRAFMRPGEVLYLNLRWLTAGRVENLDRVFVHFGIAEAAPVAQSDHELADGFTPISKWPPQHAAADRHALLLPADLPPGQYLLLAGVYDSQTNVRAQVLAPSGCASATTVCIGRVTVAP